MSEDHESACRAHSWQERGRSQARVAWCGCAARRSENNRARGHLARSTRWSAHPPKHVSGAPSLEARLFLRVNAAGGLTRVSLILPMWLPPKKISNEDALNWWRARTGGPVTGQNPEAGTQPRHGE